MSGRPTMVWVVTETNKVTRHKSIYGVFTTQAAARKDYGDEDPDHIVAFDECEVVA